MGAPRFTEAELARAIRAARREGAGAVEVKAGVIRILLDDSPSPPHVDRVPDDEGLSEWDAAFAEASD